MCFGVPFDFGHMSNVLQFQDLCSLHSAEPREEKRMSTGAAVALSPTTVINSSQRFNSCDIFMFIGQKRVCIHRCSARFARIHACWNRWLVVKTWNLQRRVRCSLAALWRSWLPRKLCTTTPSVSVSQVDVVQEKYRKPPYVSAPGQVKTHFETCEFVMFGLSQEKGPASPLPEKFTTVVIGGSFSLRTDQCFLYMRTDSLMLQ